MGTGSTLTRPLDGALAYDVAAAREGKRELPEFGAIGLHEARHAYASMQLAAGVSVANVSRYCGHHSPAFTQGPGWS